MEDTRIELASRIIQLECPVENAAEVFSKSKERLSELMKPTEVNARFLSQLEYVVGPIGVAQIDVSTIAHRLMENKLKLAGQPQMKGTIDDAIVSVKEDVKRVTVKVQPEKGEENSVTQSLWRALGDTCVYGDMVRIGYVSFRWPV